VRFLKLTAAYANVGVLSPFLFAVYVDDLIVELRQSGRGLYIGCTFTGALLYADDIALLVCSCLGLQKLINILWHSVCSKIFVVVLIQP